MPFSLMSEDPVEVIRQVAERLNAGDIEGMLELYHEDIVHQPSPEWPDTQPTKGKAAFREVTEDWVSLWQSMEIETDTVEAYGERVLATGSWRTTGRASGVEGTMPIQIVYTVRDGRITRLEWFADHDAAVAAARGD
jgi:ketosteroid isomerase-like protein